MRKFLTIIGLLMGLLPCSAQFYSDGTEPARLRWYSRETAHYRLIYPEGTDSLARVYGRYLEQYREPLGATVGYLPGQMYRRKTPVVLHAWSVISNGSVAWAPMRMDLHTLPDAYSPWPISWEKSLAIHESRHLAQMQAGYGPWFKPLYWLLGEMVPGAVAGIYPGLHLLEGDAVVAETALSRSGRGRTGDFLNYYMPAFDQGDWRDWYRWRYGSYKLYAPNHYALGYMTVAGARVFYDDPLFMKRYFTSVTTRPWRLFHLKKTLRQDTGEKTLKGSGELIFKQFHSLWQEEARAREPFIAATQVTPASDWFRAYSGATALGEDIYLICSGKAEPASLVRIRPDGTEERLRPFAPGTSRLRTDGERLYWSETVADVRWEMAGASRIRYYTIADGRIHDLTRSGRLYNPEPSPDGTRVAAVDYPRTGGTALVVLSASDGSELERWQAPDTLQFVQAVWLSETDFAVATVSDAGAAIYTLREGVLQALLPTLPVSVSNLLWDGKDILFQSDRSGVNEIYAVSPTDGWLRQLTATRYGAGDPLLYDKQLYFTSLERDGRFLFRADNLRDEAVAPGAFHRYPVAEKLSAQEHGVPALPDTVRFSEPKRFYKLPHIPHIHSWIFPLYLDMDNLQQVSNDVVNGTVKLGATALFQNLLGSATGTIGYSWGQAPEGGRRHAGHFKLTYSGLYPVFEIAAHVGERSAIQYMRRTYHAGPEFREDLVRFDYRNKTSVNGSIRAYVPLNFSSGGWSRGIVPQLGWLISNDMYDKSEIDIDIDGNFGSRSYLRFLDYQPASNVPMQVISASISAYTTQRYTSSMEYPRWGVGMEAGYRARIGLTDLYPAAAYGYLYGYLPGFGKTQGLRLSALWQHLFDDRILFPENSVSTSPRGLSSSAIAPVLSMSTDQLRLSADYALPLYFGDISVFAPVAYISHFVVKPHFDLSLFTRTQTFDSRLFSVGADIVAKLPCLLWIPYTTTAGITFDYNGGSGFQPLVDAGVLTAKNHWYIGLVFNIPI